MGTWWIKNELELKPESAQIVRDIANSRCTDDGVAMITKINDRYFGWRLIQEILPEKSSLVQEFWPEIVEEWASVEDEKRLSSRGEK